MDQKESNKSKEKIGSFVKSFDIFRKLPEDMTQGTHSGALSNIFILVSIISAFIMLVLFFNEIYEFQN